MPLPYLTARETPQNLLRPDGRRVIDGGVHVRQAANEFTLTLTGYVGAGVSAGEDGDITFDRVSAALRQNAGRPVVVEINSQGGSPFEAVAIHAALRRHGAPVAVHVMGMAASAAATIALAADPGALGMARGSRLMVHRSTALTYGDTADLATMSQLLAGIDEDTAALLAARSGMSTAKAASMIDATTFIGAEQAVALRIADAVLNQDAEPEPQAAAGPRPRPQSKMELGAVLHQAGFSRAAADRIAAGGWPALDRGHDLDFDLITASLGRGAEMLLNSLKGL